jgi:hypothetical protein
MPRRSKPKPETVPAETEPTTPQSLLRPSLPLTADEYARLLKCEAIIGEGLQTFIEVGNALLEVRDSKLYRQTHVTFEEYCAERCGISYRRAKQLMDAAQVVKNVNNCSDFPPTHESQVRPLTRLEPQQQREVWEMVTQGDPNPPARKVEQAANAVLAGGTESPSNDTDAPQVGESATEIVEIIPPKPSWNQPDQSVQQSTDLDRKPAEPGKDTKPLPVPPGVKGVPRLTEERLQDVDCAADNYYDHLVGGFHPLDHHVVVERAIKRLRARLKENNKWLTIDAPPAPKRDRRLDIFVIVSNRGRNVVQGLRPRSLTAPPARQQNQAKHTVATTKAITHMPKDFINMLVTKVVEADCEQTALDYVQWTQEDFDNAIGCPDISIEEAPDDAEATQVCVAEAEEEQEE